MNGAKLCLQAQADVARSCKTHDIPGASIVVAVADEVIEVVYGVVNTRTRVPVTPDAVFQIQSVTKVFTATLVMQLVDEGLVDLDDPVRYHLPEFRTADVAASEQITVRHLLTHSGGFEGDLWQPTTSDDDALNRFVRDLVTNAVQYSAPGRRFSYCNAGFGTLGRLVEVKRGSTYEVALRRQLAAPLGIEELAFSADQALAFRAAIGHVRTSPDGVLRPLRHWALMPQSNPAAGNQLAMSARGLAALGRVFASGGRTDDGGRILSEAAILEMLRPQLRHRVDVPTPVYQGLGWCLPRPGVAEHGGGAPGVAAMLTVVPECRLTIVVLTNADAGAKLAGDVRDALLADIADVSPVAPVPVPDQEVRVPDVTSYEGCYGNRQTVIEVKADDAGRLWQSVEVRADQLVMAQRAGFTPTVDRYELRPLTGATFVRVTGVGASAGTVVFGDPDTAGRFTTVADDRVTARLD